MTKIITLSAFLVVLGLATKGFLFSGAETGKQDGVESSTIAPSSRAIGLAPVQRSKREILEDLPERPPVFGGLRVTGEQEEAMDVFRQLGGVEGESAMDYLVDFYGKGCPGLAYTMGYALTGWMEKDFEAAMAAFHDFVREPNAVIGFVRPGDPLLFQWKGEKFHSGLM